MLGYNYLFYQCTKLSSSNPRHWGFLIVALVQGMVMFTILKVLLIEIYDYAQYQELFGQDRFIIYWTILMIPLLFLDIIHFKEGKIDDYKERWSSDSFFVTAFKLLIIITINLGAFLYLDDLLNSFRHYW